MSATFSIRDSRQLKALTGTSEEQFEKLKEKFSEFYEELRRKAYEEAVERGERKRKRGGGRKGVLPTIEDKLLFLLYYLKNYPTFDVLSSIFNMSRSKACENIHNLFPVLHETLSRIGVLPHREFANVEEMRKVFENIEQIIIDATERPHHRPKNNEKQSSMYSGKKKNMP
ncbi:DDE transposase family protein [Desulfonema ishimotonii]|uniref:DDE transposase family protein n=1 Tax=Desulfonema ishimotonii TaxID=45657 RepID=A0A401FYB8_9BACT|nr:transposase family protein [Desulfonema ishimotonii]GBC62002.1 DDE transposase family protein [Desulfonema ishimotonii]